MNTILLILLCIFEAAFAFTAIRRKADKKGWQTGRLICSTGQLGLFIIMLIAPGIDMSFRFMGLFILFRENMKPQKQTQFSLTRAGLRNLKLTAQSVRYPFISSIL